VVYSPGNRDDGTDTESRLPRALLIVVAVLGFAAYCVSFGPVGDVETLGWYVRFAALAGLVAAFGLLPKGTPLPVMMAALAAMGFLDALSSVIAASDRGWGLTLIVVLNALQATAAVVALLVGPRATNSTAAGYEAYVDYYNQAVQNYYNQHAQSSAPEQSQRSGDGQAYADAQAPPQTQRAQRPSQYVDYGELDYTGSRGSTAPGRDSGRSVDERTAGLPSFGQANASADEPRGRTEQSVWPSSTE
jgi:hypothetical protein